MFESVIEKRKQWLGGGAIVFLFIFDRIIKCALVKDFITMPYTVNERGALSFPIDIKIIIIVTIILLLFLLSLIYRNFISGKYLEAILFFGLVMGAFSNVVDRIVYGGVIDYIYVAPFLPVFNISDVLITITILSLIFLQFKKT